MFLTCTPTMEEDTIVEVREELMVSPSTGKDPKCRTAYFLKPSIKDSPFDDFPHLHSFYSKRVTSRPSNSPIEVRYNGWLGPQKEWKRWVQKMQSKYEHVWIKSGTDQAINASKYQINRNNELILELARRWLPETNTFIFPWGEATITLEDMKFCGGYSILGDPFSIPLETQEQIEAEAELNAIRRMLVRTKSKRANHYPWMMHFMKNESQVEHEGFLSLWLSRFVFPASACGTILKCVFPVAIHLARGTRIALAPPVLASIYRDFSLLNSRMMINDDDDDATKLTPAIWAPFQLVQTWALERFPTLQAQPQSQGQPRIARWHRVKMMRNYNLALILDSAGDRDCFLWRPYENSPPLMLYNEKDLWVCDNPCIDRELWSFGRCLRVSELVGLGCIEQYLPHRVAMQFGMDQDIPGIVECCKEDPWISYSQPIMDKNMYNALCACRPNPNVTSRYFDWWKQSKLGTLGDFDISICSSELLPLASCRQVVVEGSYGPSPLGLTSKFKRSKVGGCDQESDKLPIIEVLSTSPKVGSYEDEEVVGCSKALSSPQYGDALPSSCVGDETDGSMSTDGVHSSAQNKDVLRGSESYMEDGQRQTKDADRAKMKGPFCDTNGVSDMEEKGTSPCIVDMASYLENRISELERLFAKLKAEKFGPKVENISAKAKP